MYTSQWLSRAAPACLVEVKVDRIFYLLSGELKQKLWNSPLQLLVAGMLMYYVAMVMGSGYACGPGNSDVTRGVFRCSIGEMATIAKVLIVLGIGVASLFLGRAVSLLEKRLFNAR